MTKPNIPKIEADAIFRATMTCLPAITQAYRYFNAQGKTEEDFDRCARDAMTRAVRNAVELTAREVADPVWPYALLDSTPGVPVTTKPRPVAFHDKDQPNGIAWCPGYPGGLKDITPLYTAAGVAPVEAPSRNGDSNAA